MINLAPLSYLNIMAEHGGPISEFKTTRTNIDFSNMGYKTLVRLNNELVPSRPQLTFYSDYDGTGSDIYQKVSFYKAVSEALERWCFFCCSSSKNYGFEIDQTTNGMAALPSLFSNGARENAQFEAFERWSILHWWHGLIHNSAIDEFEYGKAIYITHPQGQMFTAITFSCCSNGRYVYGFGTASSKEAAKQRAVIELKRNYDLVSSIHENDINRIQNIGNIIEKRLLYFSEGEKHNEFIEKTKKNLALKNVPLKLFVDAEIKGPWSKYAKVWRCLFEPYVLDDSSREDIFLF